MWRYYYEAYVLPQHKYVNHAADQAPETFPFTISRVCLGAKANDWGILDR